MRSVNKKWIVSVLSFLASFFLVTEIIADKKSVTAEETINRFMETKDQKDFLKILDQLYPENGSKEMAERFEAFVFDYTGFSESVNREAVLSLLKDFCDSIIRYEERIKAEKEIIKKYSSGWLSDFKKEFGTSELSADNENIRMLIRYFYLKAQAEYFDACFRELIFTEFQYIETLKTYLGYVLQFYETLNPEEKEQMAQQKKYAETLLEIASQYPMHQILSGRSASLALSKIMVEKEIGTESKLYQFFLNHPTFQKPIDPIRVFEDVKRQ